MRGATDKSGWTHYRPHLRARWRLMRRKTARRSLFVVGGLCVGAIAVLMALLADRAQAGFAWIHGAEPHIGFVITPIGFGVATWLARHVFPNSQGSGIPQVIAALQMPDRAERGRLVSLRTAFGKILVMSFALLCGASTGREGPTVQVGGAIMHAFGARAPFRQSGFLLAGAAAGVAAAFNTPLAGIVFGIEELSRSFETRTSGLIIGAVIAAGLTSLAVVGDYSYFGSTAEHLPLGAGWLTLLAGGFLGGATGGVFILIGAGFARGLPGAPGVWISRHPVAFAGLCGLGVALCGLHGDGALFGTGYAEARAIVHAEGDVDPWFGPLKFIATLLSTISGIPGGVFSPSLSIGAGEGSLLGLIFPQAPLGALALIGMVAFLTGVTQAPITAFVIVSEMTDDHAMIIPLMLAALIARSASRVFSRDGFYHALAHNFLRRAENAKA